MDTNKLWDVVVVGAGVVGSATTYHLAKQGFNVLLLEQFALGHARGSSNGGSRIIRYGYAQNHYAQMMPENFRFWKELEQETGSTLLREVGMLVVEGGDTPELNKYREVMIRQGTAFKEFPSNRDLQREYPMFQFPEDSKGILDVSASILYANKCVKALQDMSRKHGANIMDHTCVQRIYPKLVTSVMTSRGEFRTKFLVLCPGPWAQALLQKVHLKVPLKVIPGMQFFWRVKTPGEFDPGRTPILVHRQPVPDGGYQFNYSFPEDERPGSVKLATRGEPLLEPVDPDHPDGNQANRRHVARMLSGYIRETLPGLEDQPDHMDPCLYTITPDHEYILDRHPRYKTMFIAAGMSGQGFKTAPVVGKIITELIQKKPTSYDISLFSLSRFRKKSDVSKSQL